MTARFAALLGPVVAVALLVGSGCSNSGGSAAAPAETDDAYVVALAAVLEDQDELVPGLDPACLAAGIVDAIGGADTLRAAGVTPEDLADANGLDALDLTVTEEQIVALGGVFDRCDVSLLDAVLETAGIDGLSEEARACAEDALDERALGNLFAASLLDDGVADDEAAFVELLEPVFECLGL